MSVFNPEPDVLRRQLRRIRAITPRPVLLAFTAPWERDAVLETALTAGFHAVQVFWWNGPRLAPRIRRGGGTVFWHVGTVAEARDAMAQGAAVLIAQGTEAGGQVRSPRPVRELVRELRAAFGATVPIIAGGGFADRRDTRAVLDAGATAALFGTRFVLCAESNTAPRDKVRLLRARATDLCLDTRMVGEWPCAPRRRLRLYGDADDRPALYAGLGVGRMRSLPDAASLVRRLSPATNSRFGVG